MSDDKKGALAETLKESVEYVGIIIRYTASGFIGLLVLIVAKVPTDEKGSELIKLFPWLLFVIAVIIGLTAYSMHHIVMDTIFNFFSVKLNHLFHKKSKLNDRGLFKLKRARRARRAANDSLQKDFDTTFSLLNYLYCSSYLLILISIFCHLLGLWQNPLIHWWQIGGIGIFLLIFTFIGDYLITKEEFEEEFTDNG